jgi:hypothetical protein
MAPELITHEAACHTYRTSRTYALIARIDELRDEADTFRGYAAWSDNTADTLRDELNQLGADDA